jgi:hypothetical protein
MMKSNRNIINKSNNESLYLNKNNKSINNLFKGSFKSSNSISETLTGIKIPMDFNLNKKEKDKEEFLKNNFQRKNNFSYHNQCSNNEIEDKLFDNNITSSSLSNKIFFKKINYTTDNINNNNKKYNITIDNTFDRKVINTSLLNDPNCNMTNYNFKFDESKINFNYNNYNKKDINNITMDQINKIYGLKSESLRKIKIKLKDLDGLNKKDFYY